jgi:hypothetical protein
MIVEAIDIIVSEIVDYLNDNFSADEYDSYEDMCDDIIAQETDIVEYCANASDWADTEPEDIMPLAAEFMSRMEYDRKEILKYIKSYNTMVVYAYLEGFDTAYAQFTSNFDEYDFC